MTRLERYWSRFARRQRVVDGALVLENPFLPMLEVNAAHTLSVVPRPILLSPASLEVAGYRLEREFLTVELTVAPLSSLWVEQVPWSRATALAQVWCEQSDALDWKDAVSSELARVLQTHADLSAYLAFDGDRAVGAMIVSSDGFCGFWAGQRDAARGLFARGVEAFGKLEVSVEDPSLTWMGEARVLERYRVWWRA